MSLCTLLEFLFQLVHRGIHPLYKPRYAFFALCMYSVIGIWTSRRFIILCEKSETSFPVAIFTAVQSETNICHLKFVSGVLFQKLFKAFN